MATGQRKIRRDNLMRQNPHCYWCGIEVIDYQIAQPKRLPDDQATLDHLQDRLGRDKRPMLNGKPLTVLACYKCNLERSAKKQQEMQRKGIHV